MLLERRGKKVLEQQGKEKGFETFQDQILGEDHYSDSQEQAYYSPCPYAAQQL